MLSDLFVLIKQKLRLPGKHVEAIITAAASAPAAHGVEMVFCSG